MDVIIKEKGGITVFKVKGEVNNSNFLELRKVFTDFIDKGKHNAVIDCAALDFIDSSGLTAFIELYVKLTKRGMLKFCSLNQNVKNVLLLTKLNTLFSIYDNLNDALNDF